MRIEIWSDVICPYCYVGRVNLDTALAESGIKAEIVHRAFRLFPDTAPYPVEEMIAKRYRQTPDEAVETLRTTEEVAAHAGLKLHLRGTKVGDTKDAHDLLLFAGVKQPVLLYNLYRAYFADGRDIFDRTVLSELAADIGLDRTVAEAAFDFPSLSARVDADQSAATQHNIRGVPFFLVDGRTAFAGAQPPTAYRKALQAIAETHAQGDGSAQK